MTTKRIEIIGITGIPEVEAGDRLSALLVRAAAAQGDPILSGDVLVVAQKVVSKAEDRFVSLSDVEPSEKARSFAAAAGKDARLIELILRESRSVVRSDPARGILITETMHGFVCANSGIDTSNVPGTDVVLLLPEDPDASARRLVEEIEAMTETRGVGIVISDTFGRPWREGQTDIAVGVAGIAPTIDYRGTEDVFGKTLGVTETAVADEIAAAAELVMGKAAGVPLAIVRGFKPTQPGRAPGRTSGRASITGGARSLVRDPENDLFR